MRTHSAISSPQELIQQGQPLVRSLAVKVRRSLSARVELDDLIAYGDLGLAEAARDFDATAGTRFTTFAYYRVRGAIYDGLAKMSWTSRAQYRRLRYQQMAGEVLANQAGTQVRDAGTTLAEDASWLGSVTQHLAVVHLASELAPDEQQGVDCEDGGPTPSAAVARLEIGQMLREMIGQLPSQQSQLISLVYFKGLKLQEAADRLEISKSWASRLHAKTLASLAAALRRIGVSE